MNTEIQRTRPMLVRWQWAVNCDDGSAVGGWTATKWGARREIRKATRRDYDATGPHGSITVGWPATT